MTNATQINGRNENGNIVATYQNGFLTFDNINGEAMTLATAMLAMWNNKSIRTISEQFGMTREEVVLRR